MDVLRSTSFRPRSPALRSDETNNTYPPKKIQHDVFEPSTNFQLVTPIIIHPTTLTVGIQRRTPLGTLFPIPSPPPGNNNWMNLPTNGPTGQRANGPNGSTAFPSPTTQHTEVTHRHALLECVCILAWVGVTPCYEAELQM